jgi:PAS domain S-box-containing protein
MALTNIAEPINGLALVLDALHCGAAIMDRAGRLVCVNDRLCELMGLPRESLVHRPAESFYEKEDARLFLRERLEAFDEPHEGEFHLPRADGKSIPIIFSGRLLGDEPPQNDYRLITIVDISAQKKADEDRKEEIETISRLSDTVLSQALELKRYNERLEERVRERTRELRDANMEAIYMLAEASEAKDSDTGAHVRRIEILSRSIAEAMGLPEYEADEIGYSAILHDVGKMLVPDNILKKPGPLNDEEREAMRLHAAGGERILSTKPFFQIARKIARSHHENWDGSGYPDGIQGGDIPLPARIVHLADVFDALTSERVYKPSWPTEQALKAIIEGAGQMFDPEVVRAFRSLLSSGKFGTFRS